MMWFIHSNMRFCVNVQMYFFFCSSMGWFREIVVDVGVWLNDLWQLMCSISVFVRFLVNLWSWLIFFSYHFFLFFYLEYKLYIFFCYAVFRVSSKMCTNFLCKRTVQIEYCIQFCVTFELLLFSSKCESFVYRWCCFCCLSDYHFFFLFKFCCCCNP